MASVMILPCQGFAIPPSRPMSQAIHNNNRRNSQFHPTPSQPFDPEDLTRRLKAHLASQRPTTEKRWSTVDLQRGLLHVPDVVAEGNELVEEDEMPPTKSNPKRRSKRMSQVTFMPVDPLSFDDTCSGKKLETVLDNERAATTNRNQFKRMSLMMEAAAVDDDRGVNKPQVKRFSDMMRDYQHGQQKDTAEEAALRTRRKSRTSIYDRNDWTQRDEEEDNRRSLKDVVSPWMAKRHSLWSIKSKKDNTSAREREIAPGDVVDASEGKTRRASIFDRFRRWSR